jgi:membrane protease YdiL (CAAX protease family)
MNPANLTHPSTAQTAEAFDVSNWDLLVFFMLAATWSLAPGLGILLGPIPVFVLALTAVVVLIAAMTGSLHCPSWRRAGWATPSSRAAIGGIAIGALAGFAASKVAGNSVIATPIPIHFVVLASTIAPVLEETFFRGILQPAMGRFAGTVPGLLITAIAFALVHKPQTLLFLFCLLSMGIAYGLMRNVTKSTAPCAVMHAAYNITVWLILLGR